eukprot:TRINITY_DN5139_c0_g1_i3.p1 TRINITY_DN5139_c0_g1~~TRINITY_DN5139_c0_g1_i3.p1  ORF type:complete len:526 (-),score=47.07 TRINITY_DN5139_c0_g1_i3:389-1855(-)
MEEIKLIEGDGSRRKGEADDSSGEKHGKDVVVDVNDSWLNSMKKKLAPKYIKPTSLPFRFCHVPRDVRKIDEDAYTPSIVSIGPFHRGSQNLQPMEKVKWHYLQIHIKDGNDLEKYCKEMKEKEQELRDFYSGNINMGVNEFIEMMLLDYFFIIQLLLAQSDIKHDDPVYATRGMLQRIGNDMLLLENQVPFFMLEYLWAEIGQSRDTLPKKVLDFFVRLNLPFGFDIDSLPGVNGHHLLHLVYSFIQPSPQINCKVKPSFQQLRTVTGKCLSYLHRRRHCFPSPPGQQSLQESENNPPPPRREVVPSATELQEAGVKFQCVNAKSLLDVTFEHGNMKLPRLRVDHFTNSLFRNFIAFEQCFPHHGSHITAYCGFMDSLVNTARDVGILSQSNIIQNELGSDEEVAFLFNNLCKGVFWNPSEEYLASVSQKVIQHTQKSWSRWRAKLVRDYFSSPWAILSLIAAIVVLILTFVQTTYTVLAYVRPKKT